MLTSLSIRNVVLIDKLDLTFEKGLGVFTGETGAGKSILLDSLSLILGARSDVGLVRHGQSQLSVTAGFSPSPHCAVWNILSDQDIEVEDNTLLIRRTINTDGKSKAFVNDQAVSLSFLKILGEQLVEIHGQFATHGLLNLATHLSVLDSYGQLSNQVTLCRHTFSVYKEAQKKKKEVENRLLNTQIEKEFLQASIQDLEYLNPKANEEETLTTQRAVLMNSEKVLSCTDAAYQLLTDDQKGIVHQLTQASRQLEKADPFSNGAFQEVLNTIYQSQEALSDASCQLEILTEKWGDISKLPQIDDRLFTLRTMARKHQISIHELPTLLEKFRADLETLEKGVETIEHLKKAEKQAFETYLKQAENLSTARQKAAETLDAKVAQELPDLKLEKAVFKTQVTQCSQEEGDETGIDRIVFLISTNKGIPLAPLNKVASGGELSRFMLALKVNLAKADAIETLIFDEVDSGIGGATADAVGLRLKRLSEECQVLAVTHAPQVAAHGIHHWTVSKNEQEKGIITQVKQLSQDERLQEIARMLSGAQITQAAQAMAKELLEKNNQKSVLQD